MVLDRLRTVSGPVEPRREDPIVCLIGTILSQATNDRLAERACRELRKRFPTWKKVMDAPCEEVEKAVEMCGLAKQKAAAIQSALRYIRRTRGALRLDDLKRPDLDPDRAMADLCRIEGVGVKTAAVTLMFGCGADLCAVDTHLLRILRRLEIVPPKASADRAFRILRPLVPTGKAVELHLQLIRFGRTTCRAVRPKCGSCPLLGICPWRGKISAAGAV